MEYVVASIIILWLTTVANIHSIYHLNKLIHKNDKESMKLFMSEYNRIKTDTSEINEELLNLKKWVNKLDKEMALSFNSQNEYIDKCITEIEYKTGIKEQLMFGDVNTPEYALKQPTTYERRGSREDRRKN